MTNRSLILFRPGFTEFPKLILTKEEVAHLRALRLADVPCVLEIRDGLSNVYFYQFTPKEKECNFLRKESLPKKEKQNSLAIALPKGNRLDFFIQKVTEIGIAKVVFLVFRHSVRRDFNLDRAKKIVMEAASQSNQSELMELQIKDFESFVQEEKSNLVVFHPRGEKIFSPDLIVGKIPVIGPEGGFHTEEEQLMEREKMTKVLLPGGILRTETAGIVAASLKMYL
ncbi:RsmE family RNA methyltransferase [Leptospira sp. 96542]|nr:RsmE family RNA methyltransferase [Leptospira sp. 96542]